MHFNTTGDKMLYMFLPFSLIRAVLQKLVMDEGTAILIIPFWPTKPWFIQVAWLLADKPTTVPATNTTLSIPGREKTYLMAGKLTLMACLFSGKSSVTEEFWKGLQPLSKTPHATPRGPWTGLTSDYGINFVCQNKLIPCTPLPWRKSTSYRLCWKVIKVSMPLAQLIPQSPL